MYVSFKLREISMVTIKAKFYLFFANEVVRASLFPAGRGLQPAPGTLKGPEARPAGPARASRTGWCPTAVASSPHTETVSLCSHTTKTILE